MSMVNWMVPLYLTLTCHSIARRWAVTGIERLAKCKVFLPATSEVRVSSWEILLEDPVELVWIE